MEIKGRIHEIGKVRQVSETFKSRDLVLEYAENPTYPEYIKFEVHQDKVTFLDKFSVGDSVEVSFNLRGRPWTDKTGKTTYFNTLVAWRINTVNGDVTQYQPPIDINDTNEDDDLPF